MNRTQVADPAYQRLVCGQFDQQELAEARQAALLMGHHHVHFQLMRQEGEVFQQY